MSTKKLELLWAELKRSGLKLTEPRKRVLRVLQADHGPFSAEEIHRKITRKVCDLATVYRTLSSLEEARIVRRCEFGDGTARYELGDHDGHHHHLICRQCRKVEVVDGGELEKLFDRIVRKHGYTDPSHHLEFFGTCSDCR